jgi:hypothetical protein
MVVQNEDDQTPQGDELKAPFCELIVTGCCLMTAKAGTLTTLVDTGSVNVL